MEKFDTHTPSCEVLDQTAKVRKVPSEPIHAANEHRVALPDEPQHLLKFRTLCAPTGSPIGESFVALDAIELSLRVLVITTDSNVTDSLAKHPRSSVKVSL